MRPDPIEIIISIGLLYEAWYDFICPEVDKLGIGETVGETEDMILDDFLEWLLFTKEPTKCSPPKIEALLIDNRRTYFQHHSIKSLTDAYKDYVVLEEVTPNYRFWTLFNKYQIEVE